MNKFDSSFDHVVMEARRIDLMLRREIVKMRHVKGESGWDEFRGLYISEEEVDDLLSGPTMAPPISRPIPSNGTELAKINESLDSLSAEIAERRTNSLRRGIPLRLEHLRQCFDLSPFEVDCLLVALLPEIDLRYQRLYAYLQDDVTKKTPTVDMALRLLGSTLDEKAVIRAAFLPQGRLAKYHLLPPGDSSTGKASALLEKTLRLDKRIVDYLLGSDQVDARLQSFVRLVEPTVNLSDVLLPNSSRERLVNLTTTEIPPQGAVVFFYGPYGSGKRMTAEALCREWEIPLMIVDLPRLLAGELPADLASALILREASLQKACPYWHGFESVIGDDRNAESCRRTIMEDLAHFPGIAFLGSRINWDPGASVGKPFVKLHLPTPSFSNRKKLWQMQLGTDSQFTQDFDLDALTNKFRFTGGQIRDAVAGARDLATGRSNGSSQLTMNDLHEACRNQCNRKLSAMAHKITPRFKWDDIVLPKDQMTQLGEIISQIKYRHVVFEQWRFDQKVASGPGLNILFAGPSGTGKTMAAEIIAGELGLDLYKIDLSTVISKYIGETEKNLDRIFQEAQDSNAILFFDEADAVFGKRSEVRDSHDRYANIEIAYLLQKTEEYDGIVILATNLRKNLDDAFARRMHFSIEFPVPEEPDRYRIWQRIFPKEAPLSANADLAFMARQFKIAGGNIKNIAVNAAFLAAGDGDVINIDHLIRATKREFQKIGRLCTEADFGSYFDLVKG